MSRLLYIDQGATFSLDQLHRFRCWRTWASDRPVLAWLMLNPSTADAEVLDPTLRRVEAFSRREGAGGFEVWNLWSLRATDPTELWRWMQARDQNEAFAGNSSAVLARATEIRRVVCAWGAFSKCPSSMLAGADRVAQQAVASLREIGCEPLRLGPLTAGGQPRHPLYLAGDTPMVPHP